MTDKSDCSNCESQIMTRFQIVGEICCATTIFYCPSLLVAALKAEYTVGKALINIITSNTELEIHPSLTFTIPKYSLWIHKAVCHICTVVLCRLMVWLYMEDLKGKIRAKEI